VCDEVFLLLVNGVNGSMTCALFAAGTIWHYVFGIGMFLVSVFLILLVLVQRGRGGGLTGALGGMGGQSAFGAKAGDVFTRVTMVTAGVWIVLCMGAIWVLGSQDEWKSSGVRTRVTGPATPGDQEAPSGTPAKPAPEGATGTEKAGEAGATGESTPAAAAKPESGSSGPAKAEPKPKS
jgi:preprotein translocase subunit SecG